MEAINNELTNALHRYQIFALDPVAVKHKKCLARMGFG